MDNQRAKVSSNQKQWKIGFIKTLESIMEIINISKKWTTNETA